LDEFQDKITKYLFEKKNSKIRFSKLIYINLCGKNVCRYTKMAWYRNEHIKKKSRFKRCPDIEIAKGKHSVIQEWPRLERVIFEKLFITIV